MAYSPGPLLTYQSLTLKKGLLSTLDFYRFHGFYFSGMCVSVGRYVVYVSVCMCVQVGMPVLGECDVCGIYGICFCKPVHVQGGMPVLGEYGVCGIYGVCFCKHVCVQVDMPM